MTKTRLLHSFEKDSISEYIWDRPRMEDNQIEIKTIFCGICRSDIGAYKRWEEMPFDGEIGHFGHEGLGRVTNIGKDVKVNVNIGDYVATWSDPAYADYYYAKENEFVIIPEPDPKYILQPIASAVNIAKKSLIQNSNNLNAAKFLLLGSGFMSFIVARVLEKYEVKFTVCGSSHKNIWKDKFNIDLQKIDNQLENSFDCVIDLTSKAENFIKIINICKNEGVICYASTPYTPVTTNFFETCWKCHTWIFPSPRNSDFNEIMAETRDMISEGYLDTDWMWSKFYDRNDLSQVKQGFIDGSERKNDYIRGYIKF